jgi:3-demethoxyubiquinol 3-hydroxylase
MWEQEQKHLAVMNMLREQHDVRPTILWDVAKVAGFGLGAASALFGREAAMACTEAVETVIGEHYDEYVSLFLSLSLSPLSHFARSQLKELEALPQSHPSIPRLAGIVREFRDDELGHLDTAVEHHSQRAPAHALLSTVVGMGCKVAIELCKRF